ncbi:MAG: UDP-N-acetylmuramate dehydrogenase [Cyclobacterium sp.]|uniref:UDP-N-acetylmuramate dehydrogenase n=1 Tax=unclassified Cyclobacterium TaxID=2615055 RepID=UPI00293BE843|nr:UDP-N-acetylmuramate dehydrogenase [Cyclobacterium sp. SYSU L10401]
MMKIQENISLSAYNTFGINKKARFLMEAESKEDILLAFRQCRLSDKPLFVLGGGSNILLLEDLDALVLKINIQGIEVVYEDDETVVMKVGAGMVWHDLVLYSLRKGLSGLENLSLIPGTVGAAPMQNIGAYGIEIKSVFDHLEAIEIATGQVRVFNGEDCRFGYRESVFKNTLKGKFIISHVAFRLHKKHQPHIDYGDIQLTLKKMGDVYPSPENISDAVVKIRQQKLPDPKALGNAGSFFKNPTIPLVEFNQLSIRYPEIPGYPMEGKMVKIPAAWLIDTAGWKGKRIGAVGVHKNQPLVLVNYGGAEGADILELSSKIQADILAKFGINLEREVNVISSGNLIQI